MIDLKNERDAEVYGQGRKDEAEALKKHYKPSKLTLEKFKTMADEITNLKLDMTGVKKDVDYIKKDTTHIKGKLDNFIDKCDRIYSKKEELEKIQKNNDNKLENHEERFKEIERIMIKVMWTAILALFGFIGSIFKDPIINLLNK